ncbi:MAG TPA: hypothetical protein V6D03_08680 [Candidatus Caenarcaniphilales bacterium]
MLIPGKMDVTIKISQFPAEAKTVKNGWREFVVDTGDREVTITVKPKIFNKLEQADKTYPSWVAAITGQMGEPTKKGFALLQPGVQVFERKPRELQATTQSETDLQHQSSEVP